MKTTKEAILHYLKEIKPELEEYGIEKIALFGSFATDEQNVYSDIDIAIVSKDFSGMPYYDVKKVSKYRRSIDLRLEIHPFSLNDINVDPPLFFMNIKNKGFRIH